MDVWISKQIRLIFKTRLLLVIILDVLSSEIFLVEKAFKNSSVKSLIVSAQCSNVNSGGCANFFY